MDKSREHYREIITKAVIGKGKKFSKTTHTIKPAHRPTSILGCWVINHHYDARRKGDSVEITGNYDINVWYSYEDNTKTDVASEKVSYKEHVPLKMRADEVMTDDFDVIARATKQPNTIEASISKKDKEVNVEVEKEFAAEVVGETKVSILVHPSKEDDYYRDVKWDEQVSDEELKDDIKPDFLGRRPGEFELHGRLRKKEDSEHEEEHHHSEKKE
ncbi:outer spore coat protein CotE [Natribacillus halophilus]|uniref:Spore coat protein E n=1 Tax=Natribacillus halophilus TaxID=549003 RepID=A0A1G8PUB7_9BACI|nr:outer spore coat protein CotE [Natribacillus halophilus]SDI95470.1 spore coat protein E [Natribacillus halophilus]